MGSEDIQIGGEGVTVEIDETHWTSAKYGRGRNLKKQHTWIFGGRERGSDNRFCVCLGPGGRRDRETLEPLIVRHIRPGSVIISDCWRAYNHIATLCDDDGTPMRYTHQTVNHRVGFTNPTNRLIHTQTVERLWGELKDKVKGRGNSRTITQSIFKYMFLRRYGDTAFHNLLVECGKSYPYEEQA